MTTYKIETNDEMEHRRMLSATDLCVVISSLQEEMRSDVKHATGEKTTEHWRGRLAELMEGNSVTLHELLY